MGVHLSRSSLHLIMHLILTVVTLSAPVLARNLYNDDDYFTELTSGDRQARELGLNFPQLDESFESPAHTRRERDGGFHGGNHKGQRRLCLLRDDLEITETWRYTSTQNRRRAMHCCCHLSCTICYLILISEE